jgi:hypothetical protein
MATATIAQLRILLNDVDAPQIFDDAHYQALIDIDTDVYRAAALAANTFAAYYATRVNMTAGPAKIENTQKFEHYKALANQYNEAARENNSNSLIGGGAPVITGTSYSKIDAANSDLDRYSSVFKRGMDNNPEGIDNTNQYETSIEGYCNG